jgi:hypothetical protein
MKFGFVVVEEKIYRIIGATCDDLEGAFGSPIPGTNNIDQFQVWGPGTKHQYIREVFITQAVHDIIAQGLNLIPLTTVELKIKVEFELYWRMIVK